ncbi:MAG: hypothetical protein E5X19_25545, partial [Mesorhizobium sp.]
GAELIDRFGPLPEEVTHLLKIVFIKALCRKANVEKLDAGPCRGSISRPSRNAFPACRSASRRHRAWSAPRNWPRPRRASPTARSTSSSARTRCSVARSPSKISAC